MSRYRTIRLGNCEFAITSMESVYQQDVDNPRSLTLSYEVSEETCEASLPALGSESQFMSLVYLDKITVTLGEAAISVVKLGKRYY